MKLSKLIKELNSLKKTHGDLGVAFDEQTINPDADSEFSIQLVEILGAFKIPWNDSSRTKSLVVLGAKRKSGQEVKMGNDPAPVLKRKK